jgi:hypothetical protein
MFVDKIVNCLVLQVIYLKNNMIFVTMLLCVIVVLYY